MARDRWHELCESVAEDDGLPTWEEASPWTVDKLYFWHRYLEITTTAMVGHPAWPAGLVYLDLFAGAGVCTMKQSGRRIPGSVLLAAQTSKPFGRIIACEKDRTLADACEARLSKTYVAARSHVLRGDCNELVDQIVELMIPGALTLAFVDPKGLDAQFSTITALSRNGRVDFVALFADAYDINRNVELYYRNNPDSKLDQVLGPSSDWRSKLDQLPNQSGLEKRRLFARIYEEQLRQQLGYTHFRHKTMSGPNGPLYTLIYASKHDLGLDFWDKAISKDATGQRELF